MIGKEFEAITGDDIEALVTNAVSEGRTIEYKEQLPRVGFDEDSKEFLYDVSSFANAGGGDLIYGIRDKRDTEGKPTGTPEVIGLAGINPDQQKTRLENMLRDGIDPRIPGIRIKHIEGIPSGPVIVLRVPKSWASPHMVKFKSSSRFFSRNSGGKYQLDVREIRASFLASESLGDKISAFRSDRVGKILASEAPKPLEPGPKFVLHLLPVGAFAEPTVVDLRTAQVTLGNSLLPMGPKYMEYGPSSLTLTGCSATVAAGHLPKLAATFKYSETAPLRQSAHGRVSGRHYLAISWTTSWLRRCSGTCSIKGNWVLDCRCSSP